VAKCGAYRDKMHDECIAMHAMLLKKKRMKISEIASELGIHEKTVRRWLTTFGLILPLSICRGWVTVFDGRNPAASDLHQD